jgi:hypothetical protein
MFMVKKIISLGQDDRTRLDTLKVDNIKMRLTYDTAENISSVTVDAPKKDMPKIETLIDMILNINATWSSALRSTALLNATNNQNTNKLVSSTGNITFIQAFSDEGQIETLHPVSAAIPIQGNKLYLGVGMRQFPAVTVISITQTNVDWVKIKAETDGLNCNCELWRGIVGANALNDLTVNLSAISQYSKANVLEFSGVTSVTDVTALNTGDSVNPDSGTTAATAQAKELAIAVLMNQTAIGMASPTNGYTMIDGTLSPVNDMATAILYKILSAIATQNTSVTSDSYPWVGVIGTFKG